VNDDAQLSGNSVTAQIEEAEHGFIVGAFCLNDVVMLEIYIRVEWHADHEAGRCGTRDSLYEPIVPKKSAISQNVN
jgi:hypothetical protein